jgi:hypothetical protein
MRQFFVFLMVLVASSACAQQGVLPHTLNDAGLPRPLSKANPAPVVLYGEGGATATLDVVMPSISDFDTAAAQIATGAVTYLQNVASFTDGDQVFFTGSGKIWYFPMGAGDTKTVAQTKAGGLSIDAGGAPPVFKLNTTADFAFVADSAVSTLTIFLGKE